MSRGDLNTSSQNSGSPEKYPRYPPVFGPLLNIGGIMAGGMIFFGFIGSRLDRHYCTGNLCLITGLFIGLFIGFYETWKACMALDRQIADREKRANAPESGAKKPGRTDRPE